MIQVMWYLFAIVLVSLILYIRFYIDPDAYCEFCYKEFDTQRQEHYETEYTIELGLVRAYDRWFFCSYECQLMHLEQFEQRNQQ
jgi:hypothetical protein